MERGSLILALCAALVAAGCGGGDGGDGASKQPAAPTKAEYVAQLDAVCRKGQAEVKRIDRRFERLDARLARSAPVETGRANLRKAAENYQALIDLREGASAALRDLPAPRSGPATRYFEARDRVTAAFDDRRRAVLAYAESYPGQGEVARLQRTNRRLVALSRRQNAAAGAYGVKVCSR